MFWHKFCDIVSFAMYDNPAILVVVVLCNLIAMKLVALRLLLPSVVHDAEEERHGERRSGVGSE